MSSPYNAREKTGGDSRRNFSSFPERSEGQTVVSDIRHEEDDIIYFRISNVNVCFANAIRRTILSDIDVCCILSENNDSNQVIIEKNTGRLHNEIIKHRLSLIPIHFSGPKEKMEIFCKTYFLEVDCKNDTELIKYVTTKNFQLKNFGTNEIVENMTNIFPANAISNDYIDLCRLRPKICDSIPGEELKLTAKFSISNAKSNAMYNVVSKCLYTNTINKEGVTVEWNKKLSEMKIKNPSITGEEIKFAERNFANLDQARIFINDSFDFVIQSVGTIRPLKIVKLSLDVLTSKLQKILQEVEDKTIVLKQSETTMDNCFDIILFDEDYTIGKILEFILYNNLYVKDKILSFCGFKKFHPHDTKSTIRIAFTSEDHVKNMHSHLSNTIHNSLSVIEGIRKQF
jgi:DNA-directed RNA polymerase subunit L